jgi:CheY-like chemotaxis protein
MSAYLSDASTRAARAAGAVGVLSKPFATEVLAQAVDKVLEPRA